MALYHKHRPQTFQDVVGQEHIIETLQNQIRRDTVAHAYLFTGPRGVGKTTNARILAKAVNCKNRPADSAEPCNTCDSCEEISSSRSIDVIEIDAASNTGVDNVREHIIESVRFQPAKSKKKVFIIDEVHMLSTSAFNALLKTLEEPPAHVHFILATTELHKLPATIVSRCQVFHFGKIPYELMKRQLEAVAGVEGVTLDPSVIDRIINKSDGCDRDAISLLDQALASGEKHITPESVALLLPVSNTDDTLQFLSSLIKKNAASGIEKINELAESGTNMLQFAVDTIELLRALMVSKTTPHVQSATLDLGETAKKDLEALREEISFAEIVTLLDLLLARKQEIKQSPLPQLPFEMAVIEWCEASTPASVRPQEKTVAQHTPVAPKTLPPIQKTEVIAPPQKHDTIEVPAITPEPVKDSTSLEPVLEPTVPLGDTVCTLRDVEMKWPEFIRTIEAQSPSLVFILKMSKLLRVENNCIYLSVQYKFHADKLVDKKIQPMLQNLFSTLLNTKILINVVVQEKPDERPQDEELQELTSAFGGEVVG